MLMVALRFMFRLKGKTLKLLRHLFLFTLIGMSVVVQATSTGLTQLTENREANFSGFVKAELEPFWQQNVIESEFTNGQSLTIKFAYVIPETAKQLVVVSPGRVEGYLKYKEVVYDLVKLGFAVAIIDHQGQGLSSRRLNNPHKGYVENFNDYVMDLHQLIEGEIKPRFSGPLLLLSHSMGGAIGLRYLQQYPDVFAKAAFSSPMWGLSSGPIPKSVAKGLVNSLAWGSSLVSDQSPYFIGNKDYDAPTFEDNVLTHSQARYQYFRDTYERVPQLKLGGVTVDWIEQSVKALEQAEVELKQVKTPLLVLQSGNDKVIDNAGQDLFCQLLKQSGHPCFSEQPIVVEGAEHELLIEQDSMRNQALQQILSFYQN